MGRYWVEDEQRVSFFTAHTPQGRIAGMGLIIILYAFSTATTSPISPDHVARSDSKARIRTHPIFLHFPRITDCQT